jgi:hypothetical protein
MIKQCDLNNDIMLEILSFNDKYVTNLLKLIIEDILQEYYIENVQRLYLDINIFNIMKLVQPIISLDISIIGMLIDSLYYNDSVILFQILDLYINDINDDIKNNFLSIFTSGSERDLWIYFFNYTDDIKYDVIVKLLLELDMCENFVEDVEYLLNIIRLIVSKQPQYVRFINNIFLKKYNITLENSNEEIIDHVIEYNENYIM